MDITFLILALVYLILGSIVIRKMNPVPKEIPALTSELIIIILTIVAPIVIVTLLLDILFGNHKRTED
jgi:hypothetical protein